MGFRRNTERECARRDWQAEAFAGSRAAGMFKLRRSHGRPHHTPSHVVPASLREERLSSAPSVRLVYEPIAWGLRPASRPQGRSVHRPNLNLLTLYSAFCIMGAERRGPPALHRCFIAHKSHTRTTQACEYQALVEYFLAVPCHVFFLVERCARRALGPGSQQSRLQ